MGGPSDFGSNFEMPFGGGGSSVETAPLAFGLLWSSGGSLSASFLLMTLLLESASARTDGCFDTSPGFVGRHSKRMHVSSNERMLDVACKPRAKMATD